MGSTSVVVPTDCLSPAVDIAHEAGRLVLEYFGTDKVQARVKGIGDVVTEADMASERLVIDRLRAAFPLDGIVAEEGAAVPSRSGRYWLLDPLDGTLNYSRGIPIWCVSLSLFEGGNPVLGVIFDPIRGETFHAVSGEGAWRGTTRLVGSNVCDLPLALVHVTVDFHEDTMWKGLDDLRLLAPSVLRTRNIGSAALALAWVAAGRFDGMIHHFANAWDYGAGVVLVREAGGIVSDLIGGQYTQTTSSLLAGANPSVHKSLLSILGAEVDTDVQ